jgi:hypothetical protein
MLLRAWSAACTDAAVERLHVLLVLRLLWVLALLALCKLYWNGPAWCALAAPACMMLLALLLL